MKLDALGKKELPEPVSLRKLLGPSFILLGLGLGSGEIILWPYLSSKYGLGIIWGAVLGITFQFFLNMEIERYTLVTGESVFVGLARKLRGISPIWFILSTLIPWMWPGIIASSGTLLAFVLGIKYSSIVPIVMLLLIGMILTLGPVIYRTQETFQKTLILIGVPFVILITIILAKPFDWQSLALGLVGKGEGFWFLPAGISLASFLGAFAYAGAGGNLNLAQSFYIKEKGYGMGKFSGRITSILTGKKEDIALEGNSFETDPENMAKFKIWWRMINIEHAAIFWITGALTMTFLSLLAFATTHKGFQNLEQGLTFIIKESGAIGIQTLPIFGTAFLVVAGLMLFSTQFSVLDATSRIMSENLIIISKEKFKIQNLPRFYYCFLWIQIIAGIVIFALGFNEPLTLVTIGAVLNAFTMFIYTGLIVWLNLKSLAKPLRPSLLRISILGIAFTFYGIFTVFTIAQTLQKL